MDKNYIVGQIKDSLQDGDKIFLIRERIVNGETEFYSLNVGFGLYALKTQLIHNLNKTDDRIRSLEKK